MKNRIAQHQNDCRAKPILDTNKTASTPHHVVVGHSLDFDEYVILDEESNKYKRSISDMIYIHKPRIMNHK